MDGTSLAILALALLGGAAFAWNQLARGPGQDPSKPEESLVSAALVNALRRQLLFVDRPHVRLRSVTFSLERDQRLVLGEVDDQRFCVLNVATEPTPDAAFAVVPRDADAADVAGEALPRHWPGFAERFSAWTTTPPEASKLLDELLCAQLVELVPQGWRVRVDRAGLSLLRTLQGNTPTDDVVGIDAGARAAVALARALEHALARHQPPRKVESKPHAGRPTRSDAPSKPGTFVRPARPKPTEPLGFLPEADGRYTLDGQRVFHGPLREWWRVRVDRTRLVATRPGGEELIVGLGDPFVVALSHSWTHDGTALLHVEVRQRSRDGRDWTRIGLTCRAEDALVERVHGLPDLSNAGLMLDERKMLGVLSRLRAAMHEVGDGVERWTA